MKWTPIILLLILTGIALPACKKDKSKPEPVNLGYAGKMAGNHRWRTTESKLVKDSAGNYVLDSNGNPISEPHPRVYFDSILVFSSAKIAFASSRHEEYTHMVYDTLDSVGSSLNHTLMFRGFTSGKYYVTREELTYNYVEDTLVYYVKQTVDPPFNPGFEIYSYSP